jgi:hypothetical protein
MKDPDKRSERKRSTPDRSQLFRYAILLILTLITGLHMFLGIDISAQSHIEHIWYAILTIIILITTQD